MHICCLVFFKFAAQISIDSLPRSLTECIDLFPDCYASEKKSSSRSRLSSVFMTTMLETSLQAELNRVCDLTSLCSIYKVPERLTWCASKKCYTPLVVSIGPLHRHHHELKAMEEHKMRYLKHFIGRTNVSLKKHLVTIQGKEKSLRNCYAEAIGLNSDEFVRMILVDAAFVIEMLLKYSHCNLRDENHDRIFHKPWMIQDVWHDMRLLENQLPFFILDLLYDKVNFSDKLPLVRLSHNFFFKIPMLINGTKGMLEIIQGKMGREGTEDKLAMLSRTSEVKHFVDFIRTLYLTTSPPEALQYTRQLENLQTPSITDLHLAGVEFKVRSSENLLDLQFEGGVLEIPMLVLHDYAELTFRNMLAFEQCHCTENDINDYLAIMDRLVSTAEDVELLVKNGIIENRLRDSGAGSCLIKNLADGVRLDPKNFYYAKLCEDLNKHCERSFNKWKANL